MWKQFTDIVEIYNFNTKKNFKMIFSKKKFAWKNLFSLKKIGEDFYEELEENLLLADFGENAIAIVEELRKEIKEQKIKEQEEAIELLKKIISNFFLQTSLEISNDKLNVFCIVGVNGVGKTTTIAKIIHHFQKQKLKCSVVAGDTFRAAAREQITEWANRLKAVVYVNENTNDSASIAYDGIDSSLKKKINICTIDTAGRLHNKFSLMDQLGKLIRVIGKFGDQINFKKLLIVDATLGQNIYEQAKIFKEKIQIDGLIVTKLDTYAKGGTLAMVSNKLQLPIHFVGYGETVEDFAPFSLEEYLSSILKIY